MEAERLNLRVLWQKTAWKAETMTMERGPSLFSPRLQFSERWLKRINVNAKLVKNMHKNQMVERRQPVLWAVKKLSSAKKYHGIKIVSPRLVRKPHLGL